MSAPRILTAKSGKIGRNQEVAIYVPQELNENTQVIFGLHGNWATAARYEKYGNFFAQNGYLFIAPTYRHHYRGNQNDAELGKASIRDYASDIEFLFSQLASGRLVEGFKPTAPPILMGHSMGGPVAQLVASQNKVSGLILLNAAPVAGVGLHGDPEYKKRVKKFAFKILGGKPYLPDFDSMCIYVYNNMPAEQYRELYKKAVHESGTSSREILAGSGEGLVSWIASLLSKPINIPSESITCPILVVGCALDRIIPDRVAVDLADKYRFSRRTASTGLVIFDEHAHWVQYEQGWENSADVILEWLGKEVQQEISLKM